jgi:hypothetical protein
MKRFLTLIIVLSSICSNVFSEVNECEVLGNDHFILVHGIGGSKESFAYMKDVISKDIQCSIVHEYSYETEDSTLTTVDFAKGLDKLVKSIDQSKQKDINIIAHSQGGIVSLLWMVNSIKGTEGFTKDLALRMDSYNTLSTPFWGSDFALMGDYVFFSLGVEDSAVSPFGKAQLEHMKYGSSYYQYMMFELINPENEKVRSFLKNDLRVLNVMAMLPKLSGYSNFIGAQFFEGDAIVNVPSMTLDFNYVKTNLDEYDDKIQKLTVNEFRIADKSYVTASHLALAPTVQAVAEVPVECLIPNKCEHIPYNSLKEFYLNNLVRNDTNISNNIQGFELHVIVDLPPSFKPENNIEMQLLSSDGISMSYYLLGDTNQTPLSIIDNKAYFLFKGSIMGTGVSSAQIELEINGKLLKTRAFSTTVDKGITTFVATHVSAKTKKQLEIEEKVRKEVARKKRQRRRRAQGRF